MVIDTGAFYIAHDEFAASFSAYTIAHDREGYQSTWYDKEDYKYADHVYYQLAVPRQRDDIYFMVQSY